VNQAYKTLQKLLPRGLYLLQLHGYALKEGEIQMDAEFLLDIMELNEDIAAASSRDVLIEIKKNMHDIIEILNADISKAFKKKDFDLASEILTRLQYHTSIEEKAEKAMECFDEL
jgi:DnaJ-domain-containing protein 1